MSAHITLTGNALLRKNNQDAVQLRYSTSGTAVLNLTVADNHNVKNRQTGQWEQDEKKGRGGTTWWKVTAFGQTAERVADGLARLQGNSARVVITGRASVDEWEKTGGGTGYMPTIIADAIGIIPAQAQGASPATQQPQVTQQANAWGPGAWEPSPDTWSTGTPGEPPF